MSPVHLIALALIVGTAVSVWQAIRATTAERLATQRLVIANNALKAADIAHQQSLRNRAQALSANGSFLMAVKKYDLALQQFEAALQHRSRLAPSEQQLRVVPGQLPGPPVQQPAASGRIG